MERAGDLYVGAVSIPANTSDLEIRVKDSLGGNGMASIRLISTPSGGGQGLESLVSMILPVLVGIIILAILFFLFRRILPRKGDAFAPDGKYDEAEKTSGAGHAAGGKEIENWVSEKISAGEDPELLKKALEEMGFDPGIVDRVIDEQTVRSSHG